MYNFVLSPIDPEKLISSISERVTENILKALRNEQATAEQSEQILTIQEASEFLNLAATLLEYLKQGRKK